MEVKVHLTATVRDGGNVVLVWREGAEGRENYGFPASTAAIAKDALTCCGGLSEWLVACFRKDVEDAAKRASRRSKE